MKKKKISILAAALTTVMLTGCGNLSAQPLRDMAVEKYVTLGNYKELQVTVDPISVDDSEVEMLANNAYYSYVTVETGGITDRAVEVGDTVNIDYVGKKDGVAFDGGTAQGYNLTIGSGQFIDGFEDGLIGVMPGETVDLDLSFPENYGSADLAGQAVVFTVTANFIVPDSMENDTVVETMGIDGVNTVEELRQYAYDYLYSNAEYTYNVSLENAVLNEFMNSCIFKELPKAIIDKYQEMAREGITQQAASYGMDADTFAQMANGTDLDTFVSEYSVEAAKQDFALQAVANLENLNMDDEELNATLLEYANNAGFDTIEEFIGEDSIEDYRDYLVCEKALAFLVENAVVN